MVVRSYKLRLKRVELPIVERERLFGKTNFPIVPTAKKLLRYLYYEMRRGI